MMATTMFGISPGRVRMINAWWLVLIIPLSAFIGFAVCALTMANLEAAKTREYISEDYEWFK